MNILPKGINKIIEEYCFYQPSFMKELLNATFSIFEDTNELWSYDRYYSEIELNIKYFANNYRIIRKNHKWKVGFRIRS